MAISERRDVSEVLSDPCDLPPIPTFPQLIDRHALERPSETALVFEGARLTFEDLSRHSRQAATALLREGLKADDRFVYHGKNSAAYFILLCAAARIGAVMVPVSWRLAASEVAFILADTDARLVFADRDCWDTAQQIIGRSSTPIKLRATDPVGESAGFPEWLTASSGPLPREEGGPETVFMQLYTSGTTGTPKGVMLNAKNFFAMRARCKIRDADWDRWVPGDVAMLAMPVTHVGGTVFAMMALFHGAGAVILREFSPAAVLASIREDGITRLFLVPSALGLLLRDPAAATTDFTQIRQVLYGASPMPQPILREAMRIIGSDMCQLYGMTETSAQISALGEADHRAANSEKMSSAGRPIPGVDLRILGPSGAILPLGERGEIFVRSDANMVGYWHREEANRLTVDENGWLATGDVGYLDGDGYLYICDRIKDMICTGGENVYAAEVEAALCDYPAIAELAVIGVPDERWGEAVMAVIVPKDGPFDEAGFWTWARTRLAAYKVPKSLAFVDQLPRNYSGKVLKHALRAPYWAGRDRLVN